MQAALRARLRDASASAAGESALRRRILVVDDNIDAAQTLQMLLELEGHEVRAAHDGIEALAAARDFAPELVLLDLGLPGLSGYEVAERLRSQPGPRPALVAVTGFGQEADRRRSRAAGFDRHFAKPVRLEDLTAVLRVLPAAEPATDP
jgi:CheY-like chemotaxis protein